MVTKVQKQRIKRFVKALHSGKYKQTTGKLQDANGYCCLGVACDLYRIDMDLKSPSVIATKWGKRHAEKLPPKIQEYYGFESTNPDLGYTSVATYLNDHRNYSFKKLADLFEKKYL
jgi:hypothetical protein